MNRMAICLPGEALFGPSPALPKMPAIAVTTGTITWAITNLTYQAN
jgi:hypothetical protein